MTQALAAPSRRPALREPSETAPTDAIVGRRLWFDASITPSRSLSGRGLTIAGAALALPALLLGVGAAIAWFLPLPLPLPRQAPLPAPIQASSACVCPHAAPATIASITARLQLPSV